MTIQKRIEQATRDNILAQLENISDDDFINDLWNIYADDTHKEDKLVYLNNSNFINNKFSKLTAYQMLKLVKDGQYSTENTYATYSEAKGLASDDDFLCLINYKDEEKELVDYIIAKKHPIIDWDEVADCVKNDIMCEISATFSTYTNLEALTTFALDNPELPLEEVMEQYMQGQKDAQYNAIQHILYAYDKGQATPEQLAEVLDQIQQNWDIITY